MEKKSILFMVQLPPPVHGASLRNEFLANSQLLNGAFDIEVLRLDFAKSVADIGTFSLLKLLRMIKVSFQLFFKLLFNKPDLVYHNFAVYGMALYRDWFFVRMVKLFGINLTLHLRTQGVKDRAAKSNFKRAIYKSAFKGTSIVCLSEFLSKDIETVYSGVPIIVPNGIVEEVTVSDIANKPSNATTKFLYLSNLTKSKGILEFVDALGTLHANGANFEAEIIGPEFDVSVDQLAALLKDKGLTNKVKILGPIYGVDRFQHFIAADVFVFPTWFEAFPGVVLEAMQCALPIIATKEGAIPEIVNNEETGLLINQKDVPALTHAMKLLLDDRTLREQMGSSGRKKFEKQFTASIFEEEMKAVYENAMKQ